MKQALAINGERFDYETNVLIEAYGITEFVEVPIQTVYESKTSHKTHFDPLRDSIMIYKVIFSFSFNNFNLLPLEYFRGI